MSGIRIGKRRGYTHVWNDDLPTDGSLSARAWGIYVYLIGRPEGWKCSSRHLATVFKEGQDAVLTALHELVKAGLMVEEFYREGNLQRKRFAVPDEVSPDPGFQDLGKPDVVTTDLVSDPPPPGGANKYAGRARTPLRNHLRHIPRS